MSCDLKEKFRGWEEWLVGDDINSIRNQIHNMIWDSAVFQSINECRKYAPKNEKGEVELNGVVHQFINRCFFETQALAIRRFLDKRNDVISLYRLVNDIETNRYLLTRENILAVHGYPYDYEKEEKRIDDQSKVSQGAIRIMGEDYYKCCDSEYTHKFIDSLAGVDPSHRSPDDIIRPEILKWLKQQLNRCEKISKFVNNFLAHSATPKSRDYRNPPELDVNLGQILEAHKIICQIANFIGMNVLNRGFGDFLATPQFNQFDHFEKPWATDETIKKLHEFWRGYDKETESWGNWDWQKEFGEYTLKEVK